MEPSVLLITIDCLRSDHVGFMGYERPTTPGLDKLAEESIVFTQAFATGPRTAESFPGILASVYPLMYRAGYELTENHTTIAEVLRQRGFATAAFHSNPFLSRELGYGRGFATFNDSFGATSRLFALGEWIHSKLGEGTPLYRALRALYRVLRRGTSRWDATSRLEPYGSAEKITSQAIDWLASATGRFFLWLHYMDPHMPYLPPDECVCIFRDCPLPRPAVQGLIAKAYEDPESLSAADRQVLVDLYDAEIRNADTWIAHLFGRLESMGLCDNLIIIVTSDHGEEFGEHGDFSHGLNASKVTEGRVSVKLYDELLHVPLLLHLPGGQEAGARVTDLVSLLDLAPTVLDLLGIEQPERWLGKSLLPAVHSRHTGDPYVLSEYMVQDGEMEGPVIACRTAEWKYIEEHVFGTHELYYLLGDPLESSNVAAELPERAAEFGSLVAEHVGLLAESGVSGLQPDLDPMILDRLRGLGYIE